MIDFKLWEHDKKTLLDIVDLLNNVYPSNLTSLDRFLWKHLNNPEGNSVIACAYYEKKLIGARAFWFFYDGKERLLQPCDTVTHPGFQRRGVFSKLTNMCLDCTNDIVKFNFPNLSSMPGYLKLGWTKQKTSSWRVSLPTLNNNLIRTDIETLKEILNYCADKRWADFITWRFFDWPDNNYNFYLIDNGFYIVNSKRFCTFVAFNTDDYQRKVAPALTFSFFDQDSTISGAPIPLFVKSPPNFVVLGDHCPDFSLIDIIGAMDTF